MPKLCPCRAHSSAFQLKFKSRSAPGRVSENPFIESFNGRRWDEHLNVELFFSVADVRQKIVE